MDVTKPKKKETSDLCGLVIGWLVMISGLGFVLHLFFSASHESRLEILAAEAELPIHTVVYTVGGNVVWCIVLLCLTWIVVSRRPRRDGDG